MKRFLIALFAVALVTGLPLVAQEYEEPDLTETESELQTENDLDVDVEAEAELDDDEFGTEDDLTTDDEFGDDELPATGSELPLAGALGLLSLAGAVALRARS